jgi:hypothetical protein
MLDSIRFRMRPLYANGDARLSSLTLHDLEVLKERGISVSRDTEVRIEATTRGLSWSFNYLYYLFDSKKLRFWLGLGSLKELAIYQPIGWRDLRCKAVPVPTSASSDPYVSLLFYLDGAPPRNFLCLPAVTHLTQTMDVSDELGIFKLRGDCTMEIHFAADELSLLRRGEVLCVGRDPVRSDVLPYAIAQKTGSTTARPTRLGAP